MTGRANWNQLKADIQAWAGDQPMSSTCTCGYTTTGTAANAIRVMAEHRATKHPERATKPKRVRRAA